MHFHSFFNDKSDVYRAARPTYPEELLKFVAELAKSRDAAWDVATGNGQAAIGLAKHFAVVHATDVSENQIAHAIPHEKVVYAVKDAENPTFADASLDLVTVAQALHWFDYPKFWPSLKRVLKPGGAFAAWGYDWFKVSPEIDQLIEQHVLSKISTFWAPQNRILWEGYRAVEFPFERISTPQFELRMEWSLEHLFAYLHSWSATRRCMEREGDQFFLAAFNATQAAWGDPQQKRTVVMPLHLLAGYNS